MRLFVAIDIPKTLREQIEEFIFKNYILLGNNKLSWVKKDNLHITLKFLGETKEELVPKINERLSLSTKNCKKFSIGIKGIGVFPKLSLPKILWLGIQNGSDEIVSLVKNIEEKILELGFEKENRGFVSHLTIARVRMIKNLDKIKFFVEKFKDIDFGFCEIKEVVLYQSILKPDGPEYKVIEKHSLC